MTLTRKTPLRRDCRECGKRCEKRDGLWWHVRTSAMDGHPADPHPTKRTPKKKSQNRRKDAELRRLTLLDSEGNPRPCVNCGGLVGVQAAHIIPRSQSRAVHWDPRNILPLCAGPGSNSCHARFDRHLIDRLGLIEKTIGLDAYRALNVAASRAPERGIPNSQEARHTDRDPAKE